MKRQLTLIIVLLIAATLTFAADTQESEPEGSAETGVELNPRTGFPEIKQKPFLMFNEGLSFAQVTRLSKQEERSNFVWQDYLIGAHFDVVTENFKPLDLMLRVSAFYPFYHTFNGMQQYSKQTILYAFDLFAGPVIQATMWNYVRLNLAAGLHYMYQLSDEYHLHYLGGAVIAGIELPVAWHWTVLLDGTFSLDYPNFGTNRRMQPYDYAWQYHLDFGIRYSKRARNQYSYIRQSEKSKAREAERLRLKAEKKKARAEKAAVRKLQKKAENGVELTEDERILLEATKAANEADAADKAARAAEKERRRAEKEALKAQEAAEREAEKARLKAEKEATRAEKEAQKKAGTESAERSAEDTGEAIIGENAEDSAQ